MSFPSINDDLIEKYELERCTSWISDNAFNKVCLQFPDDLLVDAVDIALYIDARIEAKTYILGDSSFFSCCIDELGSQHIDSDAIIHFGYSCLSQYSSLPVLYILPKKELNISKLLEEASNLFQNGPTLIAYDVGYAHLSANLREQLKTLDVIVPHSVAAENKKCPCGPWCCGNEFHSTTKFGLTFCVPTVLQSIVYIGKGKQADNFLMSMKVPEFYTFEEEGLTIRSQFQLHKKLSFLVEKVKNSSVFGLLIGTVSVERYLEAIDHVKRLLKRRKRKSFIISVGKPTIAKLSNFPEIDVFVIVSCNEGSYIDNKDVIAPIVTLLELELAFNENRSWDDPISTDFSFLLQGGEGYVETPLTVSEDLANTPLTSGYQLSTKCTDNGSLEVALRSDMTIATSSFSSNPRTWDGLELKINDTEPSLAVQGRQGTAQGYLSEIP